MKIISSRIFWGALVVLAGVLFLLENLGIIEGGGIFWGLCLAIAGVLFITFFFANRSEWWALIPGMILLVTGAMILLASLVPGFDELYAGLVLLGGIGLGFLLVYLVKRENWWALFPGGILITLAAVAGLETAVSETVLGGIFFLGLGLTFGLVALVPISAGNMKWAVIPAAAFAALGVILILSGQNVFLYVFPAGLIVVGGFLVWRAIVKR